VAYPVSTRHEHFALFEGARRRDLGKFTFWSATMISIQTGMTRRLVAGSPGYWLTKSGAKQSTGRAAQYPAPSR